MKRLTLTCALILGFCHVFPAFAQPEYVQATFDSLVVEKKGPVVDSLIVGENILDLVKVEQSNAITDSMRVNIARNSLGQVKGYRVRIYFSNSQNAREESAAAKARFKASYPEHEAYRSFVNPNFKVTVGDFLSKSEALVLKAAILHQFPSAFVVREDVNLTY